MTALSDAQVGAILHRLDELVMPSPEEIRALAEEVRQRRAKDADDKARNERYFRLYRGAYAARRELDAALKHIEKEAADAS